MKIAKLTKKNLHYLANKIGNTWNGDFDGSYLEMSIDSAIPKYVRIGINQEKEEVYFFNKQAFLNHLDGFDLSEVIEAEKEWQLFSRRDGEDEYEHFFDSCMPLIESFEKLDNITLYMSSIDFIRDIAIPVLGDFSWD